MIITKIEVIGPGQPNASIELKKGVNVIVGASNTGKSYITICLQFILGASRVPKDIAKGYTQLKVTFSNNDGTPQFLLSRELEEGAKITKEDLLDGTSSILNPGHTTQKNLSSFMLEMFGLDGKVLAKGTANKTHSTLTLRILEKIFLADENRIISEDSPLGAGQNTETTQELSLIKTLLTGNDDSAIKEAKEEQESKSSIGAKKDHLESFLEKYFPMEEASEDKLTQLNTTLEQLEASRDKADTELRTLIEANAELVSRRKALQEELDSNNSFQREELTLVNRFRVLEKKYISDKERLEANASAVNVLENYSLLSCPVCGSDIEKETTIDPDEIVKSNLADIAQINTQIRDLTSTIAQTERQANVHGENVAKALGEISQIDSVLKGDIGKQLQETKKILDELDQARAEFRKKRDQIESRKKVLQEIGQLQVEYDHISTEYEIAGFDKEAQELCSKVAEILERWGFPNGRQTEFDPNTRDLVIGGKPRSHFGKGYRAVCFSAFLLGLMDYLKPLDRHPGFVILDSPLTTYKKQDESKEEDEQAYIANNLIYAFYKDLCDSYKSSQIIILENQEPDEDLHAEMNYIHFSGNPDPSTGRSGFFPVQQ